MKENLTDLILNEDFPDDLIPKKRSHKQPPFMMEKQGRIPPWVHQIAPTFFNLLTNADDSADVKKDSKTAVAGDNNSDDTNNESDKESNDLQSEGN